MLFNETLISLFVLFAFTAQGLLVINFAARKWRPSIERKYGWVVYALGIPGFILGVLLMVAKQPWYLAAAPFAYSIWAGFGAWVDLIHPIAWRSPARWSVFIPYVGLFMASQLLFWIPLWSIQMAYWTAYGLLYFVNTALNISSHHGKPSRKHLPKPQS